jgi:hypothetical protein
VSEPALTSGGAGGFLGLDRRGWPGTVIVALIAALIAVGLPLVNDLVSGDRPLEAGSTVDVGRGVTFRAADGWTLDAERTSTRDGRVTLAQGALSYVVEAGTATLPLPVEFERFAEEIRDRSGAQLFNGPGSVETDDGLVGIIGSYSAATSEGRFGVFQAGPTVVRVLAQGPPDAMAAGFDDVVSMTRSIQIVVP